MTGDAHGAHRFHEISSARGRDETEDPARLGDRGDRIRTDRPAAAAMLDALGAPDTLA